ncbi:MAG: hypothetical protein KDC53_25720 [Saprospiraceae bacterium]|nr:hypothetical protein [Saprospiraceae bacterium]
MITTYLLGGVPRAGKSIIQQTLLTKYNIPGISTDLLREGFMMGLPDFGIKQDEAGQSDEEKAHILWPYFKGILQARINYQTPLLIEGTNFLPHYLAEVKALPYLRMCMIGYAEISVDQKVSAIKTYQSHDDDWTAEMSDQELTDLVQFTKNVSQRYREECAQYDIPYFEITDEFETSTNAVIEYLMRSEHP